MAERAGRARRFARLALGRLGSTALVVWATATIVFVALRATGDPLEAVMGGPGSQAGPEAEAAAAAAYGFDQPVAVQYLRQLWQVATLQLGDSYSRKLPVADLLAANFPATALLATLALLLAWGLALVGVLIAQTARGRFGTLVRGALHGLETVASVTPQFFLGAILIVVFASGLGLFPVTGTGASGLVLPVVTLAVPVAGYLAHVMHGSLIEADAAPFALTARARGSSESRVALSHTIRHAALPALALSGWAYGSLLSGAVVVEALFARPGLGRLLLEASIGRDVPVVVGGVAIIALSYVVIMLVSDAIELVVDPRLRRRSGHPQDTGTSPRTPSSTVAQEVAP